MLLIQVNNPRATALVNDAFDKVQWVCSAHNPGGMLALADDLFNIRPAKGELQYGSMALAFALKAYVKSFRKLLNRKTTGSNVRLPKEGVDGSGAPPSPTGARSPLPGWWTRSVSSSSCSSSATTSVSPTSGASSTCSSARGCKTKRCQPCPMTIPLASRVPPSPVRKSPFALQLFSRWVYGAVHHRGGDVMKTSFWLRLCVSKLNQYSPLLSLDFLRVMHFAEAPCVGRRRNFWLRVPTRSMGRRNPSRSARSTSTSSFSSFASGSPRLQSRMASRPTSTWRRESRR